LSRSATSYYIYGTPESVADQILAFEEQTGPFGTLLYAGKDWRIANSGANR